MSLVKIPNQNSRSQSINNNSCRDRGFTLFELLIAITIGSLLILVSTLALRMGLSNLESGENWLNKTVRTSTRFDFFWQQVSSIRAIPIPKPKNSLERFDEEEETLNDEEVAADENRKPDPNAKKQKIYFKGDNDTISFISPLSLKNHYGHGLIIATYSQENGENGLDLIYKEKRLNPAVLSSIVEDSEDSLDMDNKGIVFFKDCDEITFEYLKGGAAGSANIDNPLLGPPGSNFKEWVGFIENKLPRAIKIVVTQDEEVVELIAPIMVMSSL